MGTNPSRSVVNPELRLHTIENVYLLGSSVFPTSGCANPTYTIVALAIRLAHHLTERVLDQ
jgi:choline dehydrogenase-like flavoprotein